MKAILFSLGSRGDIEPFLAIGTILKEHDWEIVYVFPEQFKELVGEDNKFYGFTKEFIEVFLSGEQSKVVTGRSRAITKRIKAIASLISKSIRINKEVTARQKEIIDTEKPDYVFYNQKCVYPVIWEFKHQGRGIFVHPFPCFLHKVAFHSVIGMGGGGNYGRLLNRLSYLFQSLALSLAIYFTTKRYHKHLLDKTITALSIRSRLLRKTKSFYTISPSLFSRPNDWPANADVVGYLERDKTKNWKPSDELVEFVASHKQIVFVTFGSMTNTNPVKKTNAVVDSLKSLNVSAIVSTSWGGLVKPERHPANILFVKDVPYDWIFPKMYAVVHHGGAGTTHSALKYGCANLIIPHFVDQFFWNRIIRKLNLGPKGVPINKLNQQNFQPLLSDLLENPIYKINAEHLGNEIKKEIKIPALFDFISETQNKSERHV
jgi:sterol 3beta-glucosyltransferase